jgi:hypothetical protein
MCGHEPQIGLDTKTYWLTDRQSQCDFDVELSEVQLSCETVASRQCVSTEAEEPSLLETLSRKRLVKTLQAGKNTVCYSDLKSVEIIDGAILTCAEVSNTYIIQTPSIVTHTRDNIIRK